MNVRDYIKQHGILARPENLIAAAILEAAGIIADAITFQHGTLTVDGTCRKCNETWKVNARPDMDGYVCPECGGDD